MTLGEPLRCARLPFGLHLLRSRRAIRSITFAASPLGGSAAMRFAEGRAFPLATPPKNIQKKQPTKSAAFRY